LRAGESRNNVIYFIYNGPSKHDLFDVGYHWVTKLNTNKHNYFIWERDF
jgi:hypothetical protein